MRSPRAKAAALTHSLAKNHGFADGNKRTALLTVLLFLARSGYRLTGQTVVTDAEQMILDLVENVPQPAPLRPGGCEFSPWGRAVAGSHPSVPDRPSSLTGA